MPAALTLAPLTDEQRVTVEQNLGLVHHFLQKRNVPADVYADRFQDGCIGLMRAVQTYDPAKGTLSTHAAHWIRSGIQNGRELEQGVNYRRAAWSGDAYVEPLLMSPLAPGADDSHTNSLDAIPASSDDFDVMLDELAAQQDVDALSLSDDERIMLAWPTKDAARFLGVNGKTIWRRRRRLCALLAASNA